MVVVIIDASITFLLFSNIPIFLYQKPASKSYLKNCFYFNSGVDVTFNHIRYAIFCQTELLLNENLFEKKGGDINQQINQQPSINSKKARKPYGKQLI